MESYRMIPIKSAYVILLFLSIILSVYKVHVFPDTVPYLRASASPEGEVFEYYGYIPPSNYSWLDSDFPNVIAKNNWEVDPASGEYKQHYGYLDNGTCYLDIVGINDSTRVWVYDITGVEPVLRDSFTVNRMELHRGSLPSKTYFKVVSDKRAALLVGGGGNYNTAEGVGWTVHAVYPSTDGGFSGKEFVFEAFSQVTGNGPGSYATVYAIDDAKVEIYDSRGTLAKSLELKANGTVDNLKLIKGVYRVTSTGRIEVASWGIQSFTVVPSVKGGYVGDHFSVYPNENKGSQEIVALVLINQDRSNRVQVIEPGVGVVAEKTLAPNTYWFTHSKDTEILRKKLIVKSSADLMMFVGGTFIRTPSITTMSQGTAFLGLKAGQPTTLYTFTKAIAFSPEANARITVGALELEVVKGGYSELPGGLITITSNATLVVQVVSQNPFSFEQGSIMTPFQVPALVSWGAYAITTEAVRMAYSPPRTAGEEANLTLYASIATATVVVVSLLIYRKPWKRR